MVTTPPRGSGRGAQQQLRPQRPEVVVRQQPSPPATLRQGEQQQEQQQQQIRELVPPLSALSPKTAAAALGMGAGKGAAEKAAGGEFSLFNVSLIDAGISILPRRVDAG